jgi:hypothetical protein
MEFKITSSVRLRSSQVSPPSVVRRIVPQSPIAHASSGPSAVTAKR